MTNDTISRAAAIEVVRKAKDKSEAHRMLEQLPTAQPEITYQTCSDALLKMWMDNVVTDGEYNRIMDKLNAWKGNPDADHN